MKKSDYVSIIKSKAYRQKLVEMAEDIKRASKVAPNEATIESRFDMELFAFFKTMFGPLGFIYNPVKEKAINTRRHISKGRADTAIATLVIEFKQPSTLSNKKQKDKAIKQISDYLLGLDNTSEEDMLEGFVTDGIVGCFVTLNKGIITKEEFLEINEFSLDRIIQNILALKLIAFNAKNLVESFCNPPDNDGVAFSLVSCLFDILSQSMKPKTNMLFNEWKQLFNLAHDDISKQQAIIDRREALEDLLGCSFTDRDTEYLGLYALQTAYAIIIKAIAFKVISQVRFNESLISFGESIEQDSETLRQQFTDLENGEIFRDYGMANLLEGDFFSWYCEKNQWTTKLAKIIKKIFELLSRYSDKAVLNESDRSQDFFKQLYEAMVPAAVRHSLGEYYTRKWLATNVVEEAVKIANVKNWKGLDPCCGSGTFLNVMIDKVLQETKGQPSEDRLNAVLSRVKGIDLNPIAVLTARVNYFLNISHLMAQNNPIDIPVYLGDSSYVPKTVKYDSVECLEYTVSTTKEPIDILLPKSIVSDTSKLAQQMIKVEVQVKNQNEAAVSQLLRALVYANELTNKTESKIDDLSKTLVNLEKKNWNGIWARILSNYLSTANLGKFDVVVGNPPWVDWKSLPSGYRERIKNLCISRKLFSGDRITGGINLNICALIANVSAENWLAEKGVLGFLMPEPLVFQPSYEGFRNFYLSDDSRLYFCKFTNWTKAGNPFKPVTQKFLSFYLSRKKVVYSKGVETDWYIKKRGKNIDGLESLDMDEYFEHKVKYLATCNAKKNFFTSLSKKTGTKDFKKIAGECSYIGREGIEFYPQELMVFKLSKLSGTEECTCLRNMQNAKSKYKVPVKDVLLETEFLHPMIKGKKITPFHVEWDEFIVPFPYDAETPRVPITMDRLSSIAPKLASYYQKNRELILAQTEYNEKIIGKKDAEFYALARVGEYSFANNYVVLRDNTKWAASVVSELDTSWGGKKRPLFQNHAVSICEDENGRLITLDEAYYICGILNSSLVYDYMMNSSDSRSFPIRPRVKIPIFDKENAIHMEIVRLSKEAHREYKDKARVKEITDELSKLYLKIV